MRNILILLIILTLSACANTQTQKFGRALQGFGAGVAGNSPYSQNDYQRQVDRMNQQARERQEQLQRERILQEMRSLNMRQQINYIGLDRVD